MDAVRDDLRFGIHSGQQHTDFPGYVALWQAAEQLGFDWASVFDHFLPIQSDPEGPCFEGMTLLAAMAASTRRLRCGVIVLGVTYRHPAVVANQAATIDHISVKAPKTISITAPRHYQAISNGRLTEQTDLPNEMRRTTWEEAEPIPSWQFSLGVAQMAVEYFGRNHGIEFSGWLFPQDRETGMKAKRGVWDWTDDAIRDGKAAIERRLQAGMRILADEAPS